MITTGCQALKCYENSIEKCEGDGGLIHETSFKALSDLEESSTAGDGDAWGKQMTKLQFGLIKRWATYDDPTTHDAPDALNVVPCSGDGSPNFDDWGNGFTL